MPYDGAAATSSPSTTTTTSEGVPIQQIRFPPSPSPLPAWITGSLKPVYTATSTQPHLPPHLTSSATMAHGGILASGVLYGGVDGPLFHGCSLMPSFFAPSSSANNAGGAPMPGGATMPTVHDPPPPKFSKLEFPTYDGSVDPLNWLNQCDQFFRGQRTLASERTWLASYHLREAAQMWYYALEKDEGGMPPWDHFRELCLLQFGHPICGSRLAKLGRLPFTSTV